MSEMQQINLPGREVFAEVVGRNRVVQVAEAGGPIAVTFEKQDGNACVYTDGWARRLLLYPARLTTREPNAAYKLRCRSDAVGPADVDHETMLKWLSHPCSDWPHDPAAIVASWARRFRFTQESISRLVPGLREPQIGAIHAIAAHWTVDHEPATVVMPTGTGKTEAMLAVMVHCACDRILVMVPSDALRTQLHRKFCTLGCLRAIDAVPISLANPVVAMLKAGIHDPDEMETLVRKANVVVATASILNSSSQEAQARLASLCSHLFIDEAHHIAAPTWEKSRRLFEEKPIVQFTATPYRRDGKRIEGSIIYNYPLGRAQQRGYFKPIDFRPVDELDDDQASYVIAEEAISRLRADLATGHDHLILARVGTINDADPIAELYRQIAPEFAPVAIHSRLSAAQRKARLANLVSRASRVLVCVDMFGEGFDLPQLKIAAMHAVHKSLPVTLQFVGRFTRTVEGVGDAAVVVNIADPKVGAELKLLYAEDSNWNSLLRRNSEQRIDREISLQRLIESFEGNLPNEVPLWNLRPALSTLIYTTPQPAWDSEEFVAALPQGEVRWYAASDERNVAIAVFARRDEVRWGRYRNIKDWTWHLVLAYWNKEQNLLYLHASDYKALNCSRVAKALTGDATRLVHGPRMFRVFHEIERPMVKNLGASRAGTVRFTMYFGPDVTAGLSQVEKAESELSNLFGWGYENGDRITRGCSVRKGKVWSVSGGRITDWQDWCTEIGAKLNDDDVGHLDVVAGFLRPVELETRPPLVPVAIEWGEGVMRDDEDRVSVRFGDIEHRLSAVSLHLCEHANDGPIRFSVFTEDVASNYELHLGSGNGEDKSYHYTRSDGPPIFLKRGNGEPHSLEDFVERDPFVVLYANGSFSYNNFFVDAACPGAYDPQLLTTLNWAGVDIRKESQGRMREKDSIQHRVIQQLLDDFDVVFDDDAAGEAADIVALRRDAEDRVLLRLVHCKFSSQDNAGARVKDLYELCGQAQKCIRWKHGGLGSLVSHMRTRDRTWAEGGHTRFVKGRISDARALEKFSRYSRLRFDVAIVQPGLSKAAVTPQVLHLLGSTELFLKRTADAPLTVLCSE